MVFESLVVDLINRYLGSYIETLNASQLKIGLLGGNAKLENLDIKPNAFDDLNLPVKVLQGHIGSLTLKIPFKNLYTEPTIAELDGLYVLVVPNAAIKYDELKEKQYAREAKKKELLNIEEARAIQSKIGKKEEPKSDSFGEKLAAQIVKNLQVDIKNVHIRYEDSHSVPGQIFSLGITLSGLMFQFINLTCLGIYWNHDSAMFGDKARGPLKVAMRTTIAGPENPKTGFSYFDFSEIDLSFSLDQYHDVTSFLDATDRVITQNKYRKYRPELPLRGSCSLWWRYAYTSVLEEIVRRRRKMWSWDHIKQHRRVAKDYIVLWVRRLRSEKFSQEQQRLLEQSEDALDVFNIVLCRQQAELQHNQSKAKRTASSGGGGFFGWFTRSSSESSTSSNQTTSMSSGDSDDLVHRFQSEMTKEEKARLYAAIQYSEAGTTAGKFPPTYVSSIIHVTLSQLSFTLIDSQLSDPRILKMAVNKLTSEVQQRSGDQALSVKIRLDSLEAIGARPTQKQADLTKSFASPILITSRVNISDADHKGSGQLLSIDFEKNPLDRRADQCICVQADPLQFVYDAETINKIVHFLEPPKDIRLQELSSQVLSSLEDVKEVTVSGLRHLSARRIYTEVMIDVKPSYFILPDTGVYRNNCRLLLVDLGSLTVHSIPNRPLRADISRIREYSVSKKTGVNADSTTSQDMQKALKATFDELKEGAYDKYDVIVSSIQVIMVEENEDWRTLRTKDQSPSHILRPLGMTLTLKRCLLHNDANLPKILLDGCLPLFRVDLTDRVLKSLFELVSNVPFPEPDQRLTTPEKPEEVLKDALVLSADRSVPARDLLRAARRLDRSSSESTVSSWFSETLDNVDEEAEEEEEEEEDDDDLSDDRVEKLGDLPTESAEANDLRFRANKAKRKMQREAAIQRRRRANVVDLKVNFVIRTIQLQILKRESESSDESVKDTVIVCFSVHEVGTNVMKRRWDQEFQSHGSNPFNRVHCSELSFTVNDFHNDLFPAGFTMLFLLFYFENWFDPHHYNHGHLMQAHIGTLSIAIPSYLDSKTKEPVCLAKTRRHVEGHHLLAVNLLVAEKSAPDFETRYNNTRHHLRCEFKTLELCLHQEATLLLIEYFNELVSQLALPGKDDSVSSTPAELQWAKKVGDKQGMSVAEARAEAEKSSDKQLPGNLTAAVAIESHIARKVERRNIRLDAASAATKAVELRNEGKMVVIRELSISQWLVNATLDKVKLTLCSDSMTVLSTHVHGLRLDVRTTYSTLEVSAILSELSVKDLIESTDYRKILWVDPAESIVALQLTHFIQGTELPDNQYNPDKVDMAVSLQLGKVHLIFLYHFAMRIVNFMNAFQLATEAMLRKVQSLSNAAVQQVQQAVSQPPKFRMGLNIVAQAPVVYMPQHSFSTNALMVDFGCVTFNNRFELSTESNRPSDAIGPIPEPGLILEHTEIRLENLRLSRLNQLGVAGEAFASGASQIEVRLTNIELTDTRPDASKQITKLEVTGDLHDLPVGWGALFSQVFVLSDPQVEVVPVAVCENVSASSSLLDIFTHEYICRLNSSVGVHLRSIHLCASMGYLLALADFHLKSAPQLEKKVAQIAPITESGKLKRRSDPVHKKQSSSKLMIKSSLPYPPLLSSVARRSPVAKPDRYPGLLEVQVDIGDPELEVVEDIYNPKSNSLKLTAAFHIQYTMTEDVVIMDAAVKNLTMVACPYTEIIGGKCSKEIISRTQINYYSKQPINGSLHGSLFVETLLVNINPGTIQLLSHIASSMQATGKSAQVGASPLPSPAAHADCRLSVLSATHVASRRRKTVKEESFWDPVPLEELDLPYLRESDVTHSEQLEGATPPGCDVSKVLEQMEDRRVDREDKDIIVIRLQTVRVILESQVGSKSMPMLILESSVDGEVLSPSTELELKVTLDVSLSYYNDVLNQWEQILETLPDDGDRMWSIQFELSTVNMDELIAEEDLDEVGCLQTSTNTILLVSRDNLELTLSKSALDMLSNLGRSFEAAYKQEFISFDYELGGNLPAPYRIQNRTGWPLVLRLESSGLQVLKLDGGKFTSKLGKVFINGRRRFTSVSNASGTDQPLYSDGLGVDAPSADANCYLLNAEEELGYTEQKRTHKPFTLRALTDRAPRYTVRIAWSDPTAVKPLVSPEASLSLNESGTSVLQLPRPASLSGSSARSLETISYPVVAQVTAHLGMRAISLRSTVRVVNDTTERLCLYSRVAQTSKNNRPELLICMEPGEIYALPVQVVNSIQYTGIYIVPDKETPSASSIPAYWPEAACAPCVLQAEHELIYLSPVSENASIPVSTSKTLQTIESATQNPHPSAVLIWPVQLIKCQINDKTNTTCYYNVVTLNGSHTDLAFGSLGITTQPFVPPSAAVISNPNVNDFLMVIRNSVVLHNQLPIPINYVVAELSGEIEAGAHTALRTVRPTKSTIDIWFEYDGRVYRGKPEICNTMDELTVCTFESREGYELLTLLTEYNGIFGKSSDDSEVVHPASFTGALLYSSLTKSMFGKRKIDDILPVASCHTSSEEDETGSQIERIESNSEAIESGQDSLSLISQATTSNTATTTTVNEKAGSRRFRWLGRGAKQRTGSVKNRATKQATRSEPKLRFAVKNKASLRVDGSQWSDRFSLDTVGSSGRVNCRTKENTAYEIGVKIDLSSSGLTKIITLMPYFMIVNKANINLECSEADEPGDTTRSPTIGGGPKEWIHVPAGEAVPFWPHASSSKKMLLRCRVAEHVVTDVFPFYESHSILMKLPGKYIGVFVEVETTEEATVIILQTYQEGMALVRLVNHLGDCQAIHFQQRGVNKMHQLEAGMSVMYAWDCARSQRELQFYCDKNDHIQSNRLTMLDNQKMDCTFPVVLATYPQPKSVAFDSGPKPLVELSAIVARTADPGSFRFKYFRVLVQEMQLKLDQGFLTDVVYFFGSTVSRVAEEEAFKRDYQLVENRLIDSPVVISHLQEGNRSVFDNLHISPIKMHVSFSLTGSTEGKSNAFPSEVLNLFLQSLGVVLTDVQDVIFKLAYFERQACIMTVNQMIAEMTRHYVSQGIRQMYVLVLGLDVLGNPFGVLRGMAQGVEDLFYEPVKGAVLGPEEFAEGVALGVKSLFGHTVGGAAGAVSRITGTIGKGVAALTLDEDYKRHRREQLAHRPENFGAGLAQGGKGLVMGFFHGVSGVITKPVEGAKKDGFEGFFKGVGKGLIGAVTRPVSGVVDFASSSFEGIRRFADTVEEIDRVRPPRYLRMDGVIRPYERREAEGHLILRKLDKDANYGQYMYHITASRGKNVLVLTNSDLLQIENMDLLGTWSTNWQTKLDALASVPVVNRNGIVISLKERQKKLFSSGNQTRQFDCTPAAAMAMVREIDAALTKVDGWSPTSGTS
ncbi:Vacuolar protein sorting-associated protein 13C [Fasciola gigantica]|uniref:Vacuolar protein sorting-associated protein 13C n=1 Tax=Fasciola gigantica TaxID=46835 RepID=A0A504YZT6_FASGI|nr:Vacuolar protein sorting-associated protein 13C [Fasciola gigantica]